MTIEDLQRRVGAVADGMWLKQSRAALLAAFTNRRAPAATSAQIEAIALRLGVTSKQLRAVAAVESNGGGYDDLGRPKILFERHKFHQFTKGKWSASRPSISNPKRGGYLGGSREYDRLNEAVALNPDAAFASASWGKFQVMGFHAVALKYPSAFDLALSTVKDEGGHYELLARFIEANGLQRAMRNLSANPETCRAFAEGFNGTGYEANAYHRKLAQAMA